MPNFGPLEDPKNATVTEPKNDNQGSTGPEIKVAQSAFSVLAQHQLPLTEYKEMLKPDVMVTDAFAEMVKEALE